MADDLADRIRARLTALNISEREASRRAGFGLSYVGDVINSRSKEPGTARLITLARVLECDLEYLLGINPTPRRPAEGRAFNQSNDMSHGTPRLINLFSADSTKGRAFGEMRAQPIDKIAALPTLANVPDAYAFAVFSNTMEPRYFVGEVVYIHPGLPVRPNDFAFVRLKSGGVGIAQFVSGDETHTRVRLLKLSAILAGLMKGEGISIEDDGVLAIPSDDVELIQRVVGSATI
jgi:hypothetical protein